MGFWSWKLRPERKALPAIRVEEGPEQRDSFIRGMTVRRIEVCTEQGVYVGYVKYGVTPPGTAVWVGHIEVEKPMRLQGYGLALLHYLQVKYSLPIHPVQVLYAAMPFWKAAAERFQVGQRISVSEFPTFEEEWARLQVK